MKHIRILNSKYPCIWSKHFTFQIGFKHYNVGFIIDDNHFRLMLIWWHVCFSF